MTKEEFDAAVKALRGKVVARNPNKKKAECTPEEWAANLDYYAEANRKSRSSDPERTRIKNREHSYKWRAANLEKSRQLCRGSAKKWAMENPEKRRDYHREWAADARRSDPDFKLRGNLRTRLYDAVKGNAKKGSAIRDMGCTIAEFWSHMESKFQPGMTRENMGTAWEIDHIYPLAKANLQERAEFLAVNNWRNLQPLTPEQNNAKNDSVTPEAQVLFDQLKAEFRFSA
jgi:hypothetical protein